MAKNELDILKKALERERNARKQAESILEEKSRELYILSQKLEQQNTVLKGDLNEKSTELKGLFDNLVDAYVLMDIEGNVIKMNHSAVSLFGYDPITEKVNVVKLIYKEDIDYAMQSFSQLLKEGTFSDYRGRVITKNKGVRNVHINASIIKDENQKPIAAQGIVRDITKELAIAKNLERKNRDLNDFAHVVSHDLKSPLRGMDTLINWLREDYAEAIDEKGQETFDLLLNKVYKMDNLIDGILKYSRLDEISKKEEIDLNFLVNEILDILHIPENISVSIVNPLPIIQGDAPRLQQLFQNLLNNAISSINKNKGNIAVGFKEKVDHWEFYVRDNGKGIAKAYQKKIFEIFESLEDNEHSTGIGLSIVKKIVEFYEGDIWVDSEPGKGTIFYFTLKKT